ncbi:MAG: cyclopropane fatty acyl phospholipid synthase [Opitutaceae bacterium]|nr:cyclopropane fatty acyl phospholipid synthase [Opitutaceae bacterium]
MSRAEHILTELFASADVHCDGRRAWDIAVKDPRFFARTLAQGSLGFGESYMDGWWECAAIDAMVFRLIRAGVPSQVKTRLHAAAAWAASFLVNLQTRRRATLVGRHHYDLGNDFFAAMLGPAMQYSCAWFHGTDDLDEAQARKLERLCRKLDLRPGMRLLDIGCGWGALARHAAQHHGCRVVGITISDQQARYARDACRGLPVEIRLQDYRDVPDTFDRVISVGMMEHVGPKNHRHFMAAATGRLSNDGGIFLCHTIGNPSSRRWTDPWIARHIFPNSLVPSPAQVMRAADGLLVLEDAENLGTHYDRTLVAWEHNVRAAWPRFRPRYGDRFLRMWRYYLLSCAGAFRARDIQLYQFVFAKGGVAGGYTRPHLPAEAVEANGHGDDAEITLTP